MWLVTCISWKLLGQFNHLTAAVGKGVGHLDHVWSYGVREVGSSIPGRGNIVGWVFHPTRWLARFSLIWICLSFQNLNLFRTLSSWVSGNYRPSAPLLYEVASHVKQLPFRPLLLLFFVIQNCIIIVLLVIITFHVFHDVFHTNRIFALKAKSCNGLI